MSKRIIKNKSTEHKKNNIFLNAITACVSNAKRLLNEAEYLEFEKPLATKLYLSIIAQEELSKAFLLYLAKEGVIEWDKYILKATKNHCAKHLVGIVLDYMCPEYERFVERVNAFLSNATYSFILPREVADAINILRYEKIGRWESKNWVWDEEPKYNKHALSISYGLTDKFKQKSLYVELGIAGNVISTPKTVSDLSAEIEYERAGRYLEFLEHLANNNKPIVFHYEDIESAF